jgi:hydroxymethylbilane synthase
MRREVIIGTRGSRLAQVQSQWVLKALAAIYPDATFKSVTVVTVGDRNQTVPLELIPTWGAFVKELQEELLARKVDIAVHSLKDLPLAEVPGLTIGAIPRRADPRDVLVSRAGKLDELPPNSRLGTGSPRRTAQLMSYRQDLKIQGIRGNIDTRLNKIAKGEVDAVVLSAAGLIRLGWEEKITEYLPTTHFLPEAGQAAIAIEVRADDTEMIEVVRPLIDLDSARCVTAERTMVRELGGGCSVAMGALGVINGDVLLLRGMATGRKGLIYGEDQGDSSHSEEIGLKLARKLLALGAVLPGAKPA